MSDAAPPHLPPTVRVVPGPVRDGDDVLVPAGSWGVFCTPARHVPLRNFRDDVAAVCVSEQEAERVARTLLLPPPPARIRF